MSKTIDYLALSYKYFIELNSNRIVTPSQFVRPYRLLIPWRFDASKFSEKQTGFTLSASSATALPEMSQIDRVNYMHSPYWHIEFQKNGRVDISFKDTYTGGSDTFSFEQSFSNKGTDYLLVDVSYAMQSGLMSAERLHLTVTQARFRSVSYLHTSRPVGCHGLFNLGYTPKEFAVIYKGHVMDGRCKVLFLNTFALLLQDNLAVDAIVLLDGAMSSPSKHSSAEGIFTKEARKGNCLVCKDIIWTHNPYIVKFKFMYSNV